MPAHTNAPSPARAAAPQRRRQHRAPLPCVASAATGAVNALRGSLGGVTRGRHRAALRWLVRLRRGRLLCPQRVPGAGCRAAAAAWPEAAAGAGAALASAAAGLRLSARPGCLGTPVAAVRLEAGSEPSSSGQELPGCPEALHRCPLMAPDVPWWSCRTMCFPSTRRRLACTALWQISKAPSCCASGCFSVLHRITEWPGSSGPNPLLEQGHLEPFVQDCVRMAFEYLQAWRVHDLPGQPVPVLCHPHSTNVFCYVPRDPPVVLSLCMTIPSGTYRH